MLITHKIDIDLVKPDTPARIQVKQGDTLSRMVEITLYAEGKAWTIPTGVNAVVRYHAHDLDSSNDSKGIYDQLPDGSAACRFSGNVLQMTPVPQMFARHGIVSTDVVFVQEGVILATCSFEFYVNRSPNEGTDPEVQDYYRVVTLEQINAEFDSIYAQIASIDPSAGGGNGVSPVVTLEEISGGTRVTITDVEGKKSFDVVDGALGPQGQQGPQGERGPQGPFGDDGKSAYEFAQDGGYTGTKAEFAAKLAAEIPDTLPNPRALTFTGAVSGSYDGSSALTVNIPSAGSGGTSSGNSVFSLLGTYDLSAGATTFSLADLNCTEIIFVVTETLTASGLWFQLNGVAVSMQAKSANMSARYTALGDGWIQCIQPRGNTDALTLSNAYRTTDSLITSLDAGCTSGTSGVINIYGR